MWLILCAGVAFGGYWYATRHSLSVAWGLVSLKVRARLAYRRLRNAIVPAGTAEACIEYLDDEGRTILSDSDAAAALESQGGDTILCRTRLDEKIDAEHSGTPHERPGIGGIYLLGPQIVVEHDGERESYDLAGKVEIRQYAVYGSHVFGRPLLRHWLRTKFGVAPDTDAKCSVEYMDTSLRTVSLPETKCLHVLKSDTGPNDTLLEECEIKTS